MKKDKMKSKNTDYLIEEAFGGQAERYLVNFLKLLCERKILREFAGCCEEFIRRYNSAHGIAAVSYTHLGLRRKSV